MIDAALQILTVEREAAKAGLSGNAASVTEMESELEKARQRGFKLTQKIAQIDVAIERLRKSED